MSVRTRVEKLASAEDGSDVLDYLLNADGLGYGTFVDVPDGVRRGRGQNDWHEVHLVDENGEGVIRYIELESSGDSASFSDLKQHLKRHGSPIDELFTVVARHKSDEGPLTSPLTDDLTFLRLKKQFSSEDVEVTFDSNYFTLKRFGVEPAYLDYLDTLTVGSGQGRASLAGDVEEVFSIREVTKSFYRDFGEIFREDLQDAIHGLEDPEENLNAYTRTVVNRVLFLLFIEEKGWLDGDVDYVENRYEAVAAEEGKHVYDDFFEPLFFDALSEEGTTESDVLGRIPFLNGGLFERKDIEEEVEIDAAFFDTLLSSETDDDGEPEGFLRRYKISLQESNPSEQELVVDPEFIGRIFEMFMQEDERSEVGAFYTPKPITAYMTKNALKQHLLGETGISHDEAVSLVSDHTAPGSLSDDQIEAVDDALRSATVLDPAVGSGAFIIAMLEELVAVAEALDESVGDDRSRFRLKEEFIADTLYGVDIDAGGIELCKFRVWLHLMQDLDADHEAFLERNEEFALPNLGFKFFVGNSLVGEHDPINVDAQQETLTGGLDDTLAEIHEVRSDYQTAHGEEKDRLADRLSELTDELDTQLAIEKGDWMTEVAEEAEETFAWTLNIPEVILDGGFDIVIGNPPYEGQSKQDYIGELARFYDEKYDFYKTIPRMRHDLYQKFNIRGWELTREGGVLSYITSDTFYTIGSKQTTRQLLQNNRLIDLLRANSDTFDAAVHPAIFTMRKESAADKEYSFEYIDSENTRIEEYRALVSRDRTTRDGFKLRKESEELANAESSSIEIYRAPITIYRESLRCAFFEPTDENLNLYEYLITPAKQLYNRWEDEIRDSETLEENLENIRQNHLESLQPGNVSLLGLLTTGGQGLATGSNDDYLAYIDGTASAEKVKDRNDEFSYIDKNKNQYSWMSRVIRPEDIADFENISDKDKLEGITSESGGTWVPIVKGKGDSFYTPITEYINWSEDSVKKLRNSDRAYLKNLDYNFREGIFAAGQGTGNPTFRYTNNAVIDHSGNILVPVFEETSAKYLNGLLNSKYIQIIIKEFINGTVNTQIQDMRILPIVVPTTEQRANMEDLVDEAIAIRADEVNNIDPVADLNIDSIEITRSLSEVTDEINELVREIYSIEGT